MIAPVTDAPGRYLLQQKRASTLFTDSGLTLQLTPPAGPARELQWGVARARAVPPQPLEPHEARLNMLVGPPENWKKDLPTWGALYYPAVAPGVDLWFEAQEGGVQYSLRAERGKDLRQVRLEWRGAQELRIADNGHALEVKLAEGELREEGLRCGQEAADGTSREVPCRYREVSLRGTNLWEYVIEVDVDEPGRPAWVDPTIQWNTFVGALGNDALENITVIQGATFVAGQFFIVGTSGSNGLDPIGPQGAGVRFFTPSTPSDVVISRRNADGSVIWTSTLGGNGDDSGKAFAIGANGDVFVAGTTTSNDLPAGPQGATHKGGKDAFIARLSSGGDTLEWLQYIGGNKDEEIDSLTLGQDGKLYAAGSTSSSQLPASDAGTSRGGIDFFVSRLDAVSGAVERTLVRSGTLNEEAVSITTGEPTDAGALLYVTGYTESPDFPLANPKTPNSQTDGGREAVVLKLNEQLGTPVWGTFLGGGSGSDEARGVMYLPGSPPRLMVVGTTRAMDFPNSYPSNVFPLGANAFLATFDPTNGNRTFSTVVGGSGEDEGLALTTGSFGSIYIGGRTTSTDLPVPFGFDSQSSATEGFVIRMAPDAGGFLPEWGTYVGGSLDDDVRALAAGPDNDVLLIGGMTRSSEMLPHQLRTIDTAYTGGEDMYLISLDALDLTPPLGKVQDGISGDIDRGTNPQALTANWNFTDRETFITDYEFGAGTIPGCDDIARFRSVGRNVSIALGAPQEIPALEPGRWYFATVTAQNQLGLKNKVSSNGYFLLLPDGGPSSIPNAPTPGTPCPGAQPDGGSADGGADAGTDAGTDGGPQPGTDGGLGQESPVGWSCNCGTTGGPAGLVLLVLVALGLRTARRES